MVLFPDFETGGSQFISRQNEWSWEMVLIYIYNYFCLWTLLPRRKKYLSDFSLCITWCTQGEEVARCACVNPAVFKSSDMVGAVLALQCWIAVGLCSYHLTSLVLKFFFSATLWPLIGSFLSFCYPKSRDWISSILLTGPFLLTFAITEMKCLRGQVLKDLEMTLGLLLCRSACQQPMELLV